jgi:hypothetical protein
MLNQTLCRQAQVAYDAARNSPCPDWQAVAELFRGAIQSWQVKPKRGAAGELPDYNVDRVKLHCRSPRIAVRFMDGEAVFTHCPSAAGKPLNIGRALRVAIVMYRSRKGVQQRAGFREMTALSPCPKFSRCAAWKRTNCSIRTLVTSIRPQCGLAEDTHDPQLLPSAVALAGGAAVRY